MGEIRSDPPKVLLIFAAFSRFESLLDQAPALIAEHFGAVELASERFAFVETDYYANSMGADLHKQLFACRHLHLAESLPAIKRRTNAIEESIARDHPGLGVARPFNLDPGYLDMAKLVLASTKDHAHRLYLGSGIYGEVTLHYRAKQWQPWPWTYPDYRRPEVSEFLTRSRSHFRKLQERQLAAPSSEGAVEVT